MRPICTVDEGTVSVVCEGGGGGGGGILDFESLLEQAGNSADDSRKTSNICDLVLTNSDYQFEKRSSMNQRGDISKLSSFGTQLAAKLR